MPIWIVNATWLEDEAEVREQWQVNAATIQEAVRDVMAHIRFRPHHLETRLQSNESVTDLAVGEARRLVRT
jgi:hypothetical protein